MAFQSDMSRMDTEDEKIEQEESSFDKSRRDSSASGTFEPIHAGDRQALTRLATQLSRTQSQYSSRQSNAESHDLERLDTLQGLEENDPRLDPNSPKFDLYKWLRKVLSMLDQEGIKLKRSGVLMKNVNVSGTGSALNLQATVGDAFTAPLRFRETFNFGSKPVKRILRDFDMLMKSGEMLIVLGRPGSGCSTFLKTMCGEMHGLQVDKDSIVQYNGIPQKTMMKEFKGEVIYNQEVDKHFPHLTVGETLEHAAALRVPSRRVGNMSRAELVKLLSQVIMATYGLSHTYNTKVGDDFVRGVSGGERKRVSIAEMALASSPIAAWDNSTRGLDSASAFTFTQSLRMNADLTGSSHAVAIYQASQAIYDKFDKAIVLYEGREIFFGKTSIAKAYFENMGFFCPQRQTTGDFLTSVTNPVERVTREGYEGKTPRTPDEFEAYWHKSEEHAALQREITEHEQEYPSGNDHQLTAFRESKREAQAKHTRPKSPYVVSVPMQIKLNTKRAWQRVINDKPATFTQVATSIILALIIGSVYFGTPNASASFTSKGATLFFAILMK